MRRVTLVMVLCLLVPVAAGAVGGDRYVNASGPDFLKPFGPHGDAADRTDEPLAAVVVAIGVALVIGRGLYIYRED